MPIFILNVPCATTSTTTTTTVAPITFTTSASCNGATSEIFVNNFAGGTGTYSWIASGSNPSEAFTNINGSGTRYAITGPSYTFTGLANSTNFYIVVKDSGGNNSSAVLVTTPNCTTTTTTTTSTTTTTTTAAPSVFYIKGTNCSNSSDVRFFSYTSGVLNDGDVIQINSGANIGCWTLSTTKPGTGTDGDITGLWVPIDNCGLCDY